MIKAERSGKVKGRLALNLLPLAAGRVLALAFVFALPFVAAAQPTGLSAPNTQTAVPPAIGGPDVEVPKKFDSAEPSPSEINPIDAEEFKVQLLKRSRSGRVLLLEDVEENKPKPGKILLLKDGQTELVAIRVLKNYPGKFAAKIVLPFGPNVEQGIPYRALKKVADKIIQMIKEREQAQRNELDATKTDEQLASEVPPDDGELDRGIPSPDQLRTKEVKEEVKEPAKKAPEKKPDDGKKKPEPLWDKFGNDLTPESIEVSDEEEPFADLSVAEDLPLETHRHSITAEYAIFNGTDNTGGTKSYSGPGGRYGFNFGRMTLLKKRTVQDMFTAELGFFWYSITGYSKVGDTVNVYPLIATGRYNLLLGETLSFYAYAGVQYNFVQSSIVLPTKDLSYLTTPKAALGLGATITVGPAWAIRVEGGLDLFGVGAVVKF